MKAVVLIIVILICLWSIPFKSKIIPSAVKFLIAIGLLYPIAKACQILIIGPNWVRWWLTDFGFVIMLSIVYLYTVEIKHDIQKMKNLRIPLIKSAIFSFVFSLLIEISQLLIDYYNLKNKATVFSFNGLVARGDYMDILMYVLGFTIVIIVAFDSSLKPIPIIINKKPNKKRK
jgi:hypothetical protein